MVEDRVRDGTRIAQLLASELRGQEGGAFGDLTITAVRDVEGTVDGAFAYAVARGGERLAEVYVHEDRARVEFLGGVDAAATAGREAGLRVRPKAVRPPRTLVFLEDGVAAKRILPVFEAAVAAL